MTEPRDSSSPNRERAQRQQSERDAASQCARLFEQSPLPTAEKLAHVVKYMRRQDLTRLLARYEIFRRVVSVKGSIIECGVHHGAGLMGWANFSAILEPTNLTRQVFGFDTFEGFPAVGDKDRSQIQLAKPGGLRADCFDELAGLIQAFDQNRFLGHVPKVHLVKGDACKTIPQFIAEHPHLVVGLLFLDFDLYEPTKAAIEHFVPRMPRGAVIAFDQLDDPAWPGETQALVDTLGLGRLRLERLEFDPYVSFAAIE
jgi:hypothetical protein